ncbi:hypothetical protein P280DRAFT_507203 [Massarina eburnea CBS 473.64]|uniref:F-box domain-containing protein n=1 Tax=Massarina eburnea CBS 473.64 TaxID=1395130 RepID=A0A6A6RY83_9PLEO|nr:hypothetical protein P280DRAFT_507203 [Massarina eburnea CBS 473.64]
MAQSRAPCSFSSLSTEMKENVFKFIRLTRDKSAVRLVNRDWRDISNSIFWGRFRTDAQDTALRSLDTLKDPSCTILSSIRQLVIMTNIINNEKRAPDSLRHLIAILPRDQLQSFSCTIGLVDKATFKLLLQRQQKIEDLRIFTTLKDSTQESDYLSLDEIVSCLSKVRVLDLYFWERKGVDHHRYIVRSLPNIKCVVLCQRGNRDPIDHLQTPLETPRTFHITDLVLESFDFSNKPTKMLEVITVKSLTALYVTDIKDGATFLRDLMVSLSAPEGGCTPLRTLEITLHPQQNDPEDTIQAVEELLASFSGLENLAVETRTYRLIDKSCIENHRATMKCLALGTSNTTTPHYYSAADVHSILTTCKLLYTLCLNLPPVELGNIHNVGLHFQLQSPRSSNPKTEFEVILEHIATHPTLRGFRTLSLPLIDYNLGRDPDLVACTQAFITPELIEPAGATMQNFANEVMQYLDQRGSGIKMLSLGQLVGRAGARFSKDRNGHCWPYYHYLPGWWVDARGLRHVRAFPLHRPMEEMGIYMRYMFWTW